jgi:phenylalanyl-tRNA synthetase beta chain
MNVSLNWLKEFVDFTQTKEELSELFITHSAEVEAIYDLVEANHLVIGHVLSKEEHPDADKLSICKVDVGKETKQIICGAPNVDAGQHVIVALPGAVLPGNFKIKSSTIRGVQSDGMICSLSELGIEKKYHNEDGIHVISSHVQVGEDALKELVYDDQVMALELTPNRGDLLSIMGVAYDVSAMTRQPIKLKNPQVKESTKKLDLRVKLSTDKCLSYYARVIDDLEIKESPLFIKSRLIASGIRPINNVVDITNYVMLETGQPLHAFDYDLLGRNLIDVRLAKKGEEIITLDDQTRKLLETDIVITNGEEAVALGGVMGGAKTEVQSTTTSILLESAVFDPTTIRKTASRLDLRSEASQRYEKGVDIARTRLALERASELFIQYANATVRKGIEYVETGDMRDHEIVLPNGKINQILGTSYSKEEIHDTLTRLHFSFEDQGKNTVVYVPSRRSDVTHVQDIVEEVGRILGYDKIPETLPSVDTVGEYTEKQRFINAIQDHLSAIGLDEVVTYSLTKEEDATVFVASPQKLTRLQYPMSIDKEVLRQSLIMGLIDVARYNHARKQKDIQLFEIGHAYKEKEEQKLSGLLMGIHTDSSWQTEQIRIDFYTVKGVLENLFDRLSLSHLEFAPYDELKELHPNQSAIIKDFHQTYGFVGKLHPAFAQKYDLEDVFVFELDVDALFQSRRVLRKFKEITKTPVIERDIAIVIDQAILSSEVINHVKKAGKRLLEDVEIFDVYQGEHIEEGKKSMGVRLYFNDPNKTMETKDVDQLMSQIIDYLKKKISAILR